MGFVGISNLPCLSLAFVQDSAPFLTTYAPNVTFGKLHYNVRLYIFLSHCDFRLSPVLCECYALFLTPLVERVIGRVCSLVTLRLIRRLRKPYINLRGTS